MLLILTASQYGRYGAGRTVTPCKRVTKNLIYPFYLWYNTRPKQRGNMIQRYKTFCFSREAHAMKLGCVAFDFVEMGVSSIQRAKWLQGCP